MEPGNLTGMLIIRIAQEAGLVTLTEPDTYDLVLGEFTKAVVADYFPSMDQTLLTHLFKYGDTELCPGNVHNK